MNEIMEHEVKGLLQDHAINTYAKYVLAPWVAYESMKMHHMYEDLGFKSRTQMGKFMKKNFPTLAVQKPNDKLWKKFLFDEIGHVAPACVSCMDQLTCFSCKVSEISA